MFYTFMFAGINSIIFGVQQFSLHSCTVGLLYLLSKMNFVLFGAAIYAFIKNKAFEEV